MIILPRTYATVPLWHRSGYGEITLERGICTSSNITLAKTVERVFGNDGEAFLNALQRIGYGKPDSLTDMRELKPAEIIRPTDKEWTASTPAWESIGYDQTIAPIQVLTFYNALANGGKMVQPLLFEDSTIVLLPQIAACANIDSLRHAMSLNISEGLGKPAASEKTQVAGLQGTSDLTTDEERTQGMQKYAVEFCGYFPADEPKYTILVSMNKEGLPASGGLMAGSAFRNIVEAILP